MVVNMLYNFNHMYFSHYRFEPIFYAINLNDASFSKVFS